MCRTPRVRNRASWCLVRFRASFGRDHQRECKRVLRELGGTRRHQGVVDAIVVEGEDRPGGSPLYVEFALDVCLESLQLLLFSQAWGGDFAA